MSNWQTHDPRLPDVSDGIREYYSGRTLVRSDKNGPFEFWRTGAQVSCVCDPEMGIVCKHHAPKDIEGTPVEPRAAPDEPEPPAAGRVPFRSAEGPA